MTPKGWTSNGDRGDNATIRGRRAVITGSLWSYWPVYVGLSLAVVLVAAGLTFAVQNLKRPQPSEEIAAYPEGDIELPSVLGQAETTNLPAAEVKSSQVAHLPDIAVAKPISALPFEAAKMAREPATLPPEPQADANVEQAKDRIQLVEATPEPALPAAKMQAAQDKSDPTCGTAIHFVHSPAAANRDALKEDKLVFILHVSGNFEDPQFT